MAFPQSINPSSPVGTDSPAQGDDEFRALKQFLVDVFGIAPAPATISGTLFTPDASGQLPAQSRLTNRTGGALAAGDVVTLSTTNDNSVLLGDVSTSLRPFVVARAATADATDGLFAYAGVVTMKSQGVINRGEYIRKSATTKAVETTGVVVGDTVSIPTGSFAVALAPAASGFVTTFMFGSRSQSEVALPRSYFTGYTLSNNGIDAINDIDIAAGTARDFSDGGNIVLAAPLTKQLDAPWAPGTNVGGLDTGSKTPLTWYHLHGIKRPDTGLVDALYSLSATAPTMPASYTLRRRLGSVLTDGAGALIPFFHRGDYFGWIAPVLDVNQANPGTAAVTRTLTVPTGVIVFADVTANTDGAISALYLSPLVVSDQASSLTVAPLYMTNLRDTASRVQIMTNTLSQIRSRTNTSGGGQINRILTHGWYDRRGKDD